MVAELSGRRNIFVVHADLDSFASLKSACVEATEIVGDRGIDYLIANGAFVPTLDAYDPVSKL